VSTDDVYALMARSQELPYGEARTVLVEDALRRAEAAGDDVLAFHVRIRLTDAYREMQDDGDFPPGGAPPMRAIVATKGKRLRAQPTAMRYEQGRVHHVGTFAEMEDQQCTWVPDSDPDSPDRVDALVHAQAFLRSRERMRSEAHEPEGLMAATSAYGDSR